MGFLPQDFFVKVRGQGGKDSTCIYTLSLPGGDTQVMQEVQGGLQKTCPLSGSVLW